MIREYSPQIWVSLVLFILNNYYPSFFLLRQYLSIAVCLFSIKYIISRKPIQFFLCALLALSFHMTSIVFAPLYLLYGIQYSKRNMLLLVLGVFFAALLFSEGAALLNSISPYYAKYFGMEIEDSAWRRALMKVYIALVYLFIMRDRFYEDGINRVVFYCMLLNAFICVVAVNVFGVFRLREFFSLADIVGVPIMLKGVSDSRNIKKIVSYLLVAVYIFLLFVSFNNFITGENMHNAYQPFWLSEKFLQASGYY